MRSTSTTPERWRRRSVRARQDLAAPAPHRPGAARHRRQGVADPVREGAGESGGPGSADPLAGPQGGAVPDRGCPGAWVPGVALDGGGREFVVTVARKDVVAAYERACAAAGAHAGVVDLASFNLMNTAWATAPAASGDWLLVHVGAEYATLAVVRGGDLVFFRNRGAAGPAELADLVHQTAMYHEDRLGGGGFTRVVMAGAALRGPEQAEWIRRSLEERLGSKIESLDFRTRCRSEIGSPSAPSCSMRLRRRSACFCARGSRDRYTPQARGSGRTMANSAPQSLQSPVLQRARRPPADRAGRGRRAHDHALQRRQGDRAVAAQHAIWRRVSPTTAPRRMG